MLQLFVITTCNFKCKMEQLPFIPASKVKELLDPKKLIDVIEDALIQFSKQQGVNQPVRSLVPVVKHGG